MQTHKDQGGVQILVVFLEEFLVELFGDFAVGLVESSLIVHLSVAKMLSFWLQNSLSDILVGCE
jgi:hypothetical protein